MKIKVLQKNQCFDSLISQDKEHNFKDRYIKWKLKILMAETKTHKQEKPNGKIQI